MKITSVVYSKEAQALSERFYWSFSLPVQCLLSGLVDLITWDEVGTQVWN